MLVDIHTHSTTTMETSIYRLVVGIHTLGIHPWELDPSLDEASLHKRFDLLKQSYHPKILAIGECGLDRKRKNIAALELQQKVLEWHMDWASEVKRPLVVHCVGAHSDLLQILKAKKYNGRILLHDYAGNEEMARQFEVYDCFFSFGQRLLDPRSKAGLVFKGLPREKLFLESDDRVNFSMIELYQKAQELLALEFSEVEKLFEDNLSAFFSNLNDVSASDVINNLRIP